MKGLLLYFSGGWYNAIFQFVHTRAARAATNLGQFELGKTTTTTALLGKLSALRFNGRGGPKRLAQDRMQYHGGPLILADYSRRKKGVIQGTAPNRSSKRLEPKR